MIIIQLRYDNMYYNVPVAIHPATSIQVPCKSKGQHHFSLLLFTGCSIGSNSGLERALFCCDVYRFFHGRRQLRKGCWSLYVEYDLLHTGVHFLWLWEFWIEISSQQICWTCWRKPTILFRSSIKLPLCRWVIYFLQINGIFSYQPVDLFCF